MLISFTTDNHRSIRDEQALSMEPGTTDADPRVRTEDGHRLLPVAAIYGANASGKSNVLSALAFMRDAVAHSHRLWAPEGGIPRQPFAWGEKASEPSMFEVAFATEGIRYEYGFVANNQQFTEEWLYAFPSARKQVWFERDGSSFKFGEHLKGDNRAVENFTRLNSLFLSVAAQNRHDQLAPVFRWFSSMRVHATGRVGAVGQHLAGERFVRWLSQSPQLSLVDGQADTASVSRSDRFRQMLRAADFGIVDVKLSESGADPDDPSIPGRVLVRHQSSAADSWLPLHEESHGTRQLFRLAPSLLDALERGSVVLIDELEASFHPLFALQLLRMFNDPGQNAKNAQLIFSTHDTNLLGTVLGDPPLRRDQVWLTEKDKEGATRLYPLTDYKPRKAENLERGYLQGRYGAIPFLGDVAEIGKAKG